MEKVSTKLCEQGTLLTELTQGRELANQLKDNLCPTTSHETCEFLVQRILSSFDKALSMLNWSALLGEKTSSPMAGMFESDPPVSPVASPAGGGGGHKNVSKKRKTLHRSIQVRISSGSGTEGSLDDGYSWRKYGQKDILGANFPRAYYRCTHRITQGCLATKQVQRSDADPSVLEVLYRGRHSCMQAPDSADSLQKEKAKQNKGQPADMHKKQEEEKVDQQVKAPLVGGPDLQVETESKNTTRDEIFRSFSFRSLPVEFDSLESQLFSELMKESSYSPQEFISPATSESDYFSLSPCTYDFRTSESELGDRNSTPTSVLNSPFGDLDFPIDQLGC